MWCDDVVRLYRCATATSHSSHKLALFVASCPTALDVVNMGRGKKKRKNKWLQKWPRYGHRLGHFATPGKCLRFILFFSLSPSVGVRWIYWFIANRENWMYVQYSVRLGDANICQCEHIAAETKTKIHQIIAKHIRKDDGLSMEALSNEWRPTCIE